MSESSPSILNFEKPVTIQAPGCYRLSNAESGCYISLFYNVFPKQYCDQLLAETDALPTSEPLLPLLTFNLVLMCSQTTADYHNQYLNYTTCLLIS